MIIGDGIMPRKKKARGRPVKYTMPAPIDNATPEEVAKMVLQAKPPMRWRYMEEAERAKLEDEGDKEAATE